MAGKKEVNVTTNGVAHAVTNTGVEASSDRGVVSHVEEYRPDTVRSAPSRDNWRDPLPYYHRGLRYAFRPSPRVRLPVNARGAWVEVEGYNSRLYTSIDVKPDLKLTEAQAVNRCLNKVKDQNINLSVSAAELPLAFKMVSGRLTSIARSIGRFSKRYPKDFKKVRRVQTGGLPRHRWCEIPGGWLELQYGWIPLMRDIEGAINEVSRSRDLPIIKAKAGSQKRWLSEHIVETWTSSAGQSEKPVITVGNVQTSVCRLFYELADPDKRSSARLGLQNPLEVVWEILPYSFVVDWAVPIGPWLSNWTADQGLRFKGGCLSTVKEVEYIGSISGRTRYGDASIPVLFDIEYGKGFDRKVYDVSPFPGLYVKSPFSGLHVTNGLALLSSAFSRR